MIATKFTLRFLFPFLIFFQGLLTTSVTFVNANTKPDKDIEHLKSVFDDYMSQCQAFSRTNIDSAFVFVNKALDIARKIGDSTMVASCFNYKGILSNLNNDYKKAEKYGLKALDIMPAIDINPEVRASTYSNIAKNYKDQQEFSRSMEYYLNALRLREQMEDTTETIKVLINIGLLYSSMGNYEMALRYYHRAEGMAEAVDDYGIIGSINNSIAIAYRRLGDEEGALFHYKHALNAFEKLGWPRAEAQVLGNIGVLYSQHESGLDSALYFYNKALAIHLTGNDLYNIGISKLNIAIVFRKKGDFILAERFLYESLDKAKRINSSRLLQLVYEELSIFNEQKNKWKDAFLYYKKFKSIADSLLNIETKKQLTDLEDKYKTERINILEKDNSIQVLNLEKAEQKMRTQQITLMAVAGLSGLIIILAIFILKWYKGKQENIKNILEIKQLKTEQKMLKSQMNPHFVFNALNSIQSYISENQNLIAAKYLAKFARIIRLFLETSRNDSITLDEEINFLKLYIELEQLRFENKFTYNFHVDQNLEPEFINIPPMLIQPFVENAIIHGFKKSGNHRLNIFFESNSKDLICKVEDDGIGINESNKERNKKEYISLAMQITEERLKIFSGQLNTAARFTVKDKSELPNPQGKGTLVEITIPIFS